MSSDLFQVLSEEGFTYDSSVFGEGHAFWARPHRVESDARISRGEPVDLVELPVTFITSDFVHFEIGYDPVLPAAMPSPRDLEQVWLDQFEYQYERDQDSYLMLMLHPQSIGYGSRMLMLERFLRYCMDQPGVAVSTAQTIASEFRARGGEAASREGDT